MQTSGFLHCQPHFKRLNPFSIFIMGNGKVPLSKYRYSSIRSPFRMTFKYRSKYDKVLDHPAVVLDIETLPETKERLDGYNELFGEWNDKLSSDKKRKPSLHFFLSRVYCVGLMIHNYPETA